MSRTVKQKRAYDSPVRQAQAAATRARIVAAAAERFLAEGYARTTVRAIADAAGVAVDTVYATFGTKARVLTAVIDDRLAGGTGVANLMDRPDALAVRDEPDQRRQVALLARFMADTLARTTSFFEMMRGAALVEPEMAGVYAEMQGYRYRNLRRAVEWIAARGPLRVTVDGGAETVWAIATPAVTVSLQELRGWTSDDLAAWLEDVLSRTLLPDGSA